MTTFFPYYSRRPAPGESPLGIIPGISAYPIEHCMKPLLSPDYRPTEKESFMNSMQLEYFRQKLLGWKAELLRESNETLSHLQEESLSEPDIADRASLETDRALELRTRDRERKLISKIDEALLRIEDGSYGYCEETGEPISLKRLEARPIATLSIEAQERHERMERTHRED
jgi:DnaK suppressor protein